MALRFDGRVAIVTGAGAGLGRAYAKLLAARGASVVVNDFQAAAADAVVKEIQGRGGVAIASYDSVTMGERIVTRALDVFKRVDIVVSNAGILRDVSFAKMTQEQWDAVLSVHLQGAFAVTRAAWPHMRKQQYGRIVLVTSVNGLYGQHGQTNYASAKSAMLGFSKSLAKEGARANIRVNAIAPGAGSAMTATILPAAIVEKWKPEFVAPTVAFLCHESVPCTGCVFECGGGWTAQVKYQRTRGAFFDLQQEITPEKVQAQWQAITDFTDATDPEAEDVMDSPQIKQVLEAVKARAKL